MSDNAERLAQEDYVVLTPQTPAALEAAEALLDRHIKGSLGPDWFTPLPDGSAALATPTIDRLRDHQEVKEVVEELQAIDAMASVDLLNGAQMAGVLATVQPPPPDESAKPPPARSHLWQRRAIRADEAIEFVRERGADPATARIAQIDTGATAHPEFTSDDDAESTRILWDQGHCFFEDASPHDRLNYTGTPGHGTRVMSVISSATCGTVAGLSIVPLRSVTSSVFDLLPFAPSRVPPSLHFAAGEALESGKFMAAAEVVNISLGDPFDPRVTLCRAVDMCYEAGIVVVAAAGNIVRRVVFPARFSRTIAVGGATPFASGAGREEPRALRPWKGASRGPSVTISAPAEQITRFNARARGKRAQPQFENAAELGSGTSYAAAMTSAAAALWVALNRDRVDALKAAGEGWKVVEAFRAALVGSALQPDVWDSKNYGAGVLDMAGLVAVPFDEAVAGVTRRTAAIEEG